MLGSSEFEILELASIIRRTMPAATVNEWTFTGDVQSWINEIIKAHPALPFSEAKIEERGRGDLKRRDLTLYDQRGKPALSGEVRLPDRPDGRTPYSRGLLDNAHDKADSIGIPHFFTWNVNRFVLWKTFEPGVPITERDYKFWDVTNILTGSDLSHPRVRQQIRDFLENLLEYYGAVYTEKEVVRSRPLDERFIHILESAVDQPVVHTLMAISHLYAHKPAFKRQLDQWMRDQQGWLLSEDEQVIRDNLERAAKFSCYVLVNRIVFHTALRRKFRLGKIRVPTTISTGKELSAQLGQHFDEAKHATRDYETVFDGDFGDTLPFLNDAAVDSWRELVNQIEAFDFTKLDYDIIGHIFERLISPEERHRYGQHYTKTEIVDLINSFCIRDAQAQVLDPACGGGTFLVRAYALKRYLSAREPDHADLLEQIKGTDISAYPVHLSTLNLATRQLIDAQNYPLVARSDFFDVKPDRPIFHVPMGKAGGGGKQVTMLQVSKVDAVVGNPPYIRQELLGSAYKEKLAELIQKEFPGLVLSQRSDIYVYFFPHAAAFLRGPGSYLGLLTSIGWLDTDYGFKLQKFLLDNFRILAILESSREPWFTGARVTTAVTILQQEPDPERRLDNVVKFVQIRQLLKELFPEDGKSEDRLLRARELRDFIEGIRENLTDDRWRIRVIRQEELYRKGCWELPAGADEDEEEGGKRRSVQTEHEEIIRGEALPPYRGGKWGVYLRAPDIFFELTDRYGEAFVPLRELASIKRGVVTGADGFFFVKDITSEALEAEPINSKFRSRFGISRRQTHAIRIIRASDNSAHPVEADYLEPVLPSLMGIESVEITNADLDHFIILTEGPKAELQNQHVLKYIEWGEKQGLNERPTCRARNPWFDLTSTTRAPIILPKIQQYRHIISWNKDQVVCGSALLEVTPKSGIDSAALCALLNSTVCALAKHVYARQHGREGSIQLDVYAANMLLVPDISHTTPELLSTLSESLNRLRGRKSLDLDEEFDLADRRELDDLVLQVIGINDAQKRAKILERLYAQLREMYRATREVEKEMQVFRRRMAGRGKLTPRSIAAEIWESVDKSDLRHFPDDFITNGFSEEIVRLAPARKVQLINDLFQKGVLKANGETYSLRDPERASFAARILEEGHSGKVSIPNDPVVCQRMLEEHGRYRAEIERSFGERAAEYSGDAEWQAKIVTELWRLHRASR